MFFKGLRMMLFLLLLGNVAVLRAQTYDELEKKAEQGNPEDMLAFAKFLIKEEYESDALIWLDKASDKGNTEAMLLAGLLHYVGLWIYQDFEKAYHYFERAAKVNNPQGLYLMGEMHENGEYVEKDVKEAIELYVQAALSENKDAMYKLGIIYLNGKEEIAKDSTVALSWFEKAANANHPEGMHQYAVLSYDAGNYIEGGIWMKHAADAGIRAGLIYGRGREACYDVGMTYFYRQDEDWDEELGLYYLNKSAEIGYPKAKEALEYILKDFDNDFYNLAQKQAITKLHKYYLLSFAILDRYAQGESEMRNKWDWDTTLSSDYNRNLHDNVVKWEYPFYKLENKWNALKKEEKNQIGSLQNYRKRIADSIKTAIGYQELMERGFAKDAYDAICKQAEYKNCSSCQMIAGKPELYLYSLEEEYTLLPSPWQIKFSGTATTYSDVEITNRVQFYASDLHWEIGYKDYAEVNKAVFKNLETTNKQLQRFATGNNPYYIKGNKMLFLSVSMNVEELFVDPGDINDIILFTQSGKELVNWENDAPVVLLKNAAPYTGIITAGYFITPELLEKLKSSEWLAIAVKTVGQTDLTALENNAENLAVSIRQLEQFWDAVAKKEMKLKEEEALGTYNEIVRKWNNYLAANPFPKKSVSQRPVVYSSMDVDKFNREAQAWQQQMFAYMNNVYAYIYSIPDFGEAYLAGTSYYDKWLNFKNEQIELMYDEYKDSDKEIAALSNAIEKRNQQIISDRNAELTKQYEEQRKQKQKELEQNNNSRTNTYSNSNTTKSNQQRSSRRASPQRDYASEFYQQQRQYGMEMLRQGKYPVRGESQGYKGLVLKQENIGPTAEELEERRRSQERSEAQYAARKAEEQRLRIAAFAERKYYENRPAPCEKCGTSR